MSKENLLGEFEFPNPVEGPVMEISFTEVKQTVITMNNNRAPGPDGLAAEAWNIVGTKV